MKNILWILLFIFSFSFYSKAQCNAEPVFTSLGLPGVYPPAIQIPNLPLPLGIIDGILGTNYNQTLTLVVLEDTTMDIGSLLPSATVNAMNLAGISTIMTLDVNHVTFNVQGLPNGINYQCDIATCEYPSAIDGCVQLNGIPTVSGAFSVAVNMLINIQVPAITDPILGTVIFPATPFDIPQFTAQTYDMLITAATSVYEDSYNVNIFPNPTLDLATLFFKEPSDVIVYNIFGEQVINFKDVHGKIVFNKEEIGSGFFFVSISSKTYNTLTKLIIK